MNANEKPLFGTIAIIGTGLIGASLALAARANDVCTTVQLFDVDPAVRARAVQLQLGDVKATLEETLSGADVVIICTPAGSMGAIGAAMAGFLKEGAIVTDVGSVKAAVIDQLVPVLPDHVFFVPGHPIAGAEKSGPDAGVASLFSNRWAILTPIEDARDEYQNAVVLMRQFWEGLGAQVELMDAGRHDLVLAMTSHLPHLIAFCVVATAQDVEAVTESEVVKYSAGGFRDFTRIAASDPTMWRDVFLLNREAVLDLLGRFSEDLTALRRAIRWGDGDTLFSTFERARKMRREVIEAGQDVETANFGRDIGASKSNT